MTEELARRDVSLLTLNIHDHGNVPASVAIRCLAVVRPVAASRHRHFQIEDTAFDDSVCGTFPKPTKRWLRLCSRVAAHRFRYRIDRHVYYLL